MVLGRSRGGQWARDPQSKCCLSLLRTNNEKDLDFKLNFSWDMPKMHYFRNIFSKIAKQCGISGSAPWPPLTFIAGVLKLRDLDKLWFFNLIMTKSNFKKSVMTSFQWHLHNYVIEKRHQNNVTRFFHFVPLFGIKIFGYASLIGVS